MSSKVGSGFLSSNLVKITNTESTHFGGKYGCRADLLFDWFGFDQKSKADANST